MAKTHDPAIKEFNDILELCESKGVDDEIKEKIKSAVALAQVSFILDSQNCCVYAVSGLPA